MAGPYASLTSPYAPNHMDSALRIADLIGQQGRSAAQAKYAKRMMIGDLISGGANAVGSIFGARDDAKKTAAENQLIADMIASGKPLDLPKLIAAVGVPRAKEIYAFVEAAAAKQKAASVEANNVGLTQRHADALKQGADPAAVNIERWGEGAPLLPAQMLPDPAKVAAAAAAAAEKKARVDLEAALNAAGGDQEAERRAYRAFNAATGKDAPSGLFTPAPKVDTSDKPGLGSFEDYVTRTYGANPTPQQILEARKVYNQSDDRQRITVNTGAEGALPPRVETTVRGLATAFRNEPAVKRVVTMAEAVNFVNSLNLNTTNPADDQALIYAFAKAMDPESVVREGEYATVAKYAQSWKDNFGFDAMRILSSNTPILTAEARKNLKATITSRYQASRGSYDTLNRSYTNQINTATGLTDGSERLTDYAGLFPGGPPSGGAGGGTTAGTETAPAEVRTRLLGNDPATGKPYPDGIITMNNGRKFRKLNGVITEVK